MVAAGDDLRWGVRDMSLGDAPLVRTAVAPSRLVKTSGDSITVLVDVLIDKQGQAERVDIFKGEQPYAQAAVDAAYAYQFYPGLRADGREIKVWVELTVPFLHPASAAADTTRGMTSPTINDGT